MSVRRLSPEEIETRIKTVYGMRLNGKPDRETAIVLGVSENVVEHIVRSDAYMEYEEKQAELIVSRARGMLKSSIQDLSKKMIRNLHELLDDENWKAKAEGMKLVFRIMRIDEEANKAGDNNIIINLPGEEPKTKVIEATVQDVEAFDVGGKK